MQNMHRFLLILVTLFLSQYSIAEGIPHTQNLAKAQSRAINDVAIPRLLKDKNVTTESPNASPANVTTPPPSPKSDTQIHPGNATARTISGFTLILVIFLVACWGLWIFHKELLAGFKKCCGGRPSGNESEGALNDIIFDPEEEESGSLSQSLLPGSSS